MKPLDYNHLSQALAVATNPYRLQILHHLIEEPQTTQTLTAVLGITKSAVSQHLTVLRLLSLIDSRRVGYTMQHSLRREHPLTERLERALPELFG